MALTKQAYFTNILTLSQYLIHANKVKPNQYTFYVFFYNKTFPCFFTNTFYLSGTHFLIFIGQKFLSILYWGVYSYKASLLNRQINIFTLLAIELQLEKH